MDSPPKFSRAVRAGAVAAVAVGLVVMGVAAGALVSKNSASSAVVSTATSRPTSTLTSTPTPDVQTVSVLQDADGLVSALSGASAACGGPGDAQTCMAALGRAQTAESVLQSQMAGWTGNVYNATARLRATLTTLSKSLETDARYVPMVVGAEGKIGDTPLQMCQLLANGGHPSTKCTENTNVPDIVAYLAQIQREVATLRLELTG